MKYQKEWGDFEENPNIKYGIYYYDSSTETTKFVMDSLNIKQGETYDFIEFIGNEPIFTQIFDGYLYKLNLDNNQFVQFSQIQLPAISHKAFLNSENKIVVYNAAYSSGGWQVWRDNTIPDSYSQIVSLNYINGTKIGVSPVGSFAEYQELSVSPKFKNIIYGHQIRQGANPIKTNFYLYNIKSKQTQALSTIDVPYLTPLWIDEDTFLYTGKEKPPATVYKINLISGQISNYLENVERLIFP